MANDIETQRDTHLSSADICRRKGWSAGTMIRGERPGGGRFLLRLTAVGEGHVMAREIGESGRDVGHEFIYDLRHRHWEVYTLPAGVAPLPNNPSA